MKAVRLICCLLLFQVVPNGLYFVHDCQFPYFDKAILAGELAGLLSWLYHCILRQQGMILWWVPARLEQWAYNRTTGKPAPVIDPTAVPPIIPVKDTRQADYNRLLWLLKPYRECPECLSGQLGLLAFFFVWPLNVWGILFIPAVAILANSFLNRLWNQVNNLPQ